MCICLIFLQIPTTSSYPTAITSAFFVQLTPICVPSKNILSLHIPPPLEKQHIPDKSISNINIQHQLFSFHHHLSRCVCFPTFNFSSIRWCHIINTFIYTTRVHQPTKNCVQLLKTSRQADSPPQLAQDPRSTIGASGSNPKPLH